jgi:hypothetical protein
MFREVPKKRTHDEHVVNIHENEFIVHKLQHLVKIPQSVGPKTLCHTLIFLT